MPVTSKSSIRISKGVMPNALALANCSPANPKKLQAISIKNGGHHAVIYLLPTVDDFALRRESRSCLHDHDRAADAAINTWLLPCIDETHPNGKLDSRGADVLVQQRQVNRGQLFTAMQILVLSNATQTARKRERNIERNVVPYLIAHAEA